MPAGKRDQRIQFQSKERIDDGGGGGAIDWQDRYTRVIHAHIEPFAGPEALSMMQVEERGLYEITIHNVRTITIHDRITWISNGSKILVIKDLRDAGSSDKERTIIAQEGPVQPDSV